MTHIGPYQVLPLRAREELGAMAMKGFSEFLKAPALLESHHQIVSWYIRDTRFGSLTPRQRCSQYILQPQSSVPFRFWKGTSVEEGKLLIQSSCNLCRIQFAAERLDKYMIGLKIAIIRHYVVIDLIQKIISMLFQIQFECIILLHPILDYPRHDGLDFSQVHTD